MTTRLDTHDDRSTPARPRLRDLDLAGDSLPNTRGRTWQDRWTLGRNDRGGWLVVADGISGGEHGDRAAATAVKLAATHLLNSDLDEVAVMAAAFLAQAGVAPWYGKSSGGSTLSIVTLTPARVVAASVGDSPIFLARDDAWAQTSPQLEGPLLSWIGSPEAPVPWLDSWPADDVAAVLVCSDGVLPGGVPLGAGGAHDWVEGILADHRNDNGDDATVLAAGFRLADRTGR